MAETEKMNSDLAENIAVNNQSETLLQSLRQEPLYRELADHFLKTGKGRRPSIPIFKDPTRRLLLYLLCMKEESNSSWDVVTSWFSKLFPDVDITRGRLEYRVKTLLHQHTQDKGSTVPDLESVIEFFTLPRPLSDIGLSYQKLLDKDFPSIDESLVTNNVLYALDIFRSQECLTQAFVYKSLHALCPSFSESQLRHKVKICLKKIKDLKRKPQTDDLEHFLSAPIRDPKLLVNINKTNEIQPSGQNLNPCICKNLLKDKKLMEEKIECLSDKNNDLELQVSVLKEERNNHSCLDAYRDETKKGEMKFKELEAKIAALERKKLQTYRNNTDLRKELAAAKTTANEDKKKVEDSYSTISNLQKKVYELTAKVKLEQTLKSKYKVKYEGERNMLESLQQLYNQENEVITREGQHNKFSPNVRLAVMQLQGEANVAAKNCSKVIGIVAEHVFGKPIDAKDLPSASCSLTIADEAHHVAKKQIGDEIKRCEHFTFASDGTSRQKQHYMENHMYLNNGKILSLGFYEVATDDAETMLQKTMEMVDEITKIYCDDSEEERDEMLKEILRKMACTMSDRAANMKSFNRKLSELKCELTQEDLKTNFLYCNAHFLLGLVSALEQALQEVENTCGGKLGRDKFGEFFKFSGAKESAALRVIRMSAEIFGPRGDEKSGFRQDWVNYLEVRGIKSRFTSHRSNRFNNTFENAQAFIFHRQHIVDFLSKSAKTENLKSKSIMRDMEDKQLLSIVAAIAAFSCYLTSPYWGLMNSRTSYGQFPPYVKAIHELLLRWCDQETLPTEPDDLFKEFWTPSPSLEDFMHCLSDCDKAMVVRCFKEIARRSSIILKRQLADFLEDGKFGGDIPADLMSILNTCPLTNLVGERLFGDLDFDMSKRRHSSTHHRSTINMWKHNDTAHWLKKKSKLEKDKILQTASKKGPALRKKHREADMAVKQQIQQNLQNNERKKRKKDIKSKEAKAAILDKIIHSGGVCKTKHDLDTLFKSCKVEDLQSQIKYRKVFLGEKGLKTTGSKKALYQILLESIEKTDSDSSESEAESVVKRSRLGSNIDGSSNAIVSESESE